MISCPDDFVASPNIGDKFIVDGTLLDATASDNCEVTSITNDFNTFSSLDGATFDIGTSTVTWEVVDNAGNSSSCSFEVTISTPTGISDTEQKTELNIYPNPNNGTFTLNIADENHGEVQIIILDITGNEIYSKKITNSGMGMHEKISLGSHKKGIYLLMVRSDKNMVTKKFIVK